MKASSPPAYASFDLVYYDDPDFDQTDAYLPDDGNIIVGLYSDFNGIQIQTQSVAGWEPMATPDGGTLDTAGGQVVEVFIPCDGVNVRVYNGVADDKVIRVFMLKTKRTS